MTPLLMMLQRGSATAEKHQDWLDIIRFLVDQGADPSFISPSGKNAICCALLSGYADEELLQWLVDRGAKVVASDGEHPKFHHPIDAIRFEDNEKCYRMAKWLLNHGASVGGVRDSWPAENPAISSAAFHLNVGLIKLLITHGVDVKRADDGYWSLLYQTTAVYNDEESPSAARTRDLIEATRLLLDAGANMFRDDSGTAT